MSDLLSQLLDTESPRPTDRTLDPAQLPLRVLADWFFNDCTARNLQRRTIDFYRLKLSYLLEGAGNWKAGDVTTNHLRLLIAHYQEKRHWSVGTSNHVITTWKVFFSFLEQEEYLPDNPARRIEKLKGARYLPEPYSPDRLYALA